MRPKVMPVEKRARLLEEIAKQMSARPEVVFALVHGSFQEGEPFRDIDIVVYIDPQAVTVDHFRSYESILAAELEGFIRIPVDVRAFNDASLSFRYHALKGRAIFVKDEALLDDLRAKTWDEYLDFAPFARRYLQEVLGV